MNKINDFGKSLIACKAENLKWIFSLFGAQILTVLPELKQQVKSDEVMFTIKKLKLQEWERR